jgi:peptidoglycan/LPS O-acetylase OafA/YrhL
MEHVRAPARSFVRAGFRLDIHGLRAIAVLLVLVYHAGLPVPAGFVGVDVFFVISGFLITNHLANELASSSRVDFARFYARRARRILPAALTVAGLTVVGSLAVLPTELVKSSVQDAIATVFYVPNFVFAIRGTDYLAETAPSPFQHYWSLGVEEQFYLLWPLMLLIVWKAAKSLRTRVVALTAVVVASLLVSIYLVNVSGPWAFFSLPSRAWELGAGALIALAYGYVGSLRPAIAALLAWLGLALIVLSAFLFGEGTPFPGVAALMPVLGAVGLIAFGETAGDLGPLRLLRLTVFQFVGTISYSLYLVHWPLLVFIQYVEWISPNQIGAFLLITGLAAVPAAWLLYRFVEYPFIRGAARERPTQKRTLAYALGASLSVAVLALSSFFLVDLRPTDSGREASPIEAATIGPDFTNYVPSNLEPSLATASESVPRIYSEGCRLSASETEPPRCEYGDATATTTVALFGDSHAAQWFPALEQAAVLNEFSLQTFIKSSCPSIFVSLLRDNVPYSTCDDWRGAAVAQINEIKPELLIVSNFSRYTALGGDPVTPEMWANGYVELRAQIDPAIEIVVIAETPLFPATPALCLDKNLTSADECSIDKAEAIDATFAAANEQSSAMIGATYVDLTDYFCNEDTCGTIIGSTLIYRDSHHITVEYSRLLSEVLWGSIGLK